MLRMVARPPLSPSTRSDCSRWASQVSKLLRMRTAYPRLRADDTGSIVFGWLGRLTLILTLARAALLRGPVHRGDPGRPRGCRTDSRRPCPHRLRRHRQPDDRLPGRRPVRRKPRRDARARSPSPSPTTRSPSTCKKTAPTLLLFRLDATADLAEVTTTIYAEPFVKSSSYAVRRRTGASVGAVLPLTLAVPSPACRYGSAASPASHPRRPNLTRPRLGCGPAPTGPAGAAGRPPGPSRLDRGATGLRARPARRGHRQAPSPPTSSWPRSRASTTTPRSTSPTGSGRSSSPAVQPPSSARPSTPTRSPTSPATLPRSTASSPPTWSGPPTPQQPAHRWRRCTPDSTRSPTSVRASPRRPRALAEQSRELARRATSPGRGSRRAGGPSGRA